MVKQKQSSQRRVLSDGSLVTEESVAGIKGPGRWLIVRYVPTALFSLKMSAATSGVGRTLVVPTPYSVKMAFVDAALRMGLTEDIERLVGALAEVRLRVGVPEAATLSHTIIKIRQEPKNPKPLQPYIASVAYREFVHFVGDLKCAFDLTTMTESDAEVLSRVAPAINYFGKRGSFVQFRGVSREGELGSGYTLPLDTESFNVPRRAHVATLDDFGPEASFAALNSYSVTPVKRERHRKFVRTIVPLGVVNAGSGFTEYRAVDRVQV